MLEICILTELNGFVFRTVSGYMHFLMILWSVLNTFHQKIWLNSVSDAFILHSIQQHILTVCKSWPWLFRGAASQTAEVKFKCITLLVKREAKNVVHSAYLKFVIGLQEYSYWKEEASPSHQNPWDDSHISFSLPEII